MELLIAGKFLFFSWLGIGALSAILWMLFKKEKICLSKFLGRTFQFSIAVGGIVLFVMLFTNKSLAVKQQTECIKLEIQNRELKRGKYRRNYYSVTIYAKGVKKELVFGAKEEVYAYRFVDLCIIKGFWGIYIIENKKLTN